jgi:thioredoxin 1
MSTTIPAVTDETFDRDVLDSPDTTLVEFWAEWCGPCRAIDPVLDQLAAENHPALRIVKLNSDDNPEISARYRVLSIPTIKVFQRGEVVRTIVGAKPAAALRADLAHYLS